VVVTMHDAFRTLGDGVSQIDRVLARAASQVGYREGKDERDRWNNDTVYGRWYGLNWQPWCAMFVSWVFYTEGLPLPASTSKGFCSCYYGAEWFRAEGRWSRSPARGHVVFYDLSRDVPGSDHVGIVKEVNGDGSITAIEGNTSPDGSREGIGVFQRNRKGGIVGYGIPPYRTGDDAPPWPGRLLGQPPPMVGADVSQWQRRLKERGWTSMVVDGRYEQLDEDICRAFQTEKGLEVDGKVGPITWKAAWTAPITP
jgi:hypothetical protein